MYDRKVQFVSVVLLLSMSVGVRPAAAAWPVDGRALCTASNDQVIPEDYDIPKIASDGAGGAIVTWNDYRSGTNSDIYVQHVLATGDVDPAWPVDGRALCTATNDQLDPAIVSDGAGGALVTWSDLRNGTASIYDIYAQHVLASGAVDPAWPAEGRALCVALGAQNLPTIVSDGAGGAIVTWQDARSGDSDIYAQHVLASGALDGAWPADGRALCTALNAQRFPTMVADGAGGAIVTWQDARSGDSDIYAQHVLASGALDGAWPADGRALCTALNDQRFPTMVADGAGGAIVTWMDRRVGGTLTEDIYAQHVLASGAVDPAWPAEGRALCTAANYQQGPSIVTDGAGGAIVTWSDARGGLGNQDIYAQRVLASGALDPAWPLDGRALCTAANQQDHQRIASDGAGGAIVTWQDIRTNNNASNADIYAQHVLASGALDGAWPADGRALCTAVKNQAWPTIVADGAVGAIIAWTDFRSGTSWDIYANGIPSYVTPTLVSFVSADVAPGRVVLSWFAPVVVSFSATVYRRTPSSDWTEIALATADGMGMVTYEDRDITPGERYGYRLGYYQVASQLFTDPAWIEALGKAAFFLSGLVPNPARGALHVSFTLPAAAPATIEVVNLAGQRVIMREVGSLGAGSHLLRLDRSKMIPAGVYWVRLRQYDRVATAKAIVLD